jgi:hypothetical protein
MTAEVLELKRDLIEQNLDRVAIEIKKKQLEHQE